MYEIDNVRFKYRLGNTEMLALQGISLRIDAGTFSCITGPSGSGKTTLLNLLGLIESPQEGRIQFAGRDLRSLDEAQKNQIRRFELGFVFQNFLLFPVLSAEENVDFFLASQGLSAKERKDRVEEALVAVQLQDHRRKRPNEMSGGQRQRVAIARALAKKPKVIIADEPTASLDQDTAASILGILSKLNKDKGVTILASSHDPLVLQYAGRQIRLRDGKIEGGQA